MAAFTTAAIVGAAVVGAAATVYSVNEQRKASKRQFKRIEKQEKRIEKKEQEAKEVAREQASLDAARDDAGADINLGRGDATVTPVSGEASYGGATSRDGAVGARVGGLGNTGNGVGGKMRRGKRPSASVGL